MRTTGLFALALTLSGCQAFFLAKKATAPPATDLTPTVVEYSDTEAFDGVLEAALVARSPAVRVMGRQ